MASCGGAGGALWSLQVEQGFPPVLRWPVYKRSQICLGEKAKEEMNLVEILPPASQEDKKAKPITIASLQASVLPMVSLPTPSPPPPQASGGCLPRALTALMSGCGRTKVGYSRSAGMQSRQGGRIANDFEPWT